MGLNLTLRVRDVVFITAPDGTVIEVHLDGIQQRQARLVFEAPRSYRIARPDVVLKPMSRADLIDNIEALEANLARKRKLLKEF